MMTARQLARACALWIAATAAAHAATDTVFRCGDDARSYGDRPCAAGVRLAPVALPSERQRAEAQAVAQRDMALARSMRQERLEREREARGAAGIADGATVQRLARAQTQADRDGLRKHPRHDDGRGRAKARARAGDPRVSFEYRLPKPVKVKAPAERRGAR